MTTVENLNHYYQVHVNHLLSTRLDTDISKEFFDKVVFHGTAYNSLQTIIDSFETSGQSTFTLTGSYGTGKSTLAAVLTGLLHQNDGIRGAARNLVNDKKLLKKFDKSFNFSHEKPWLIIKAVGGVTSPTELFYKSILKALQDAKLIELLKAYSSVTDAKKQLSAYFEFYNLKRPHSSLDKMTPNEFYYDQLPQQNKVA